MTLPIDNNCYNCKKSLVKVKRKIKCVICDHLYHQKCTPPSIKEYN